MAAFQPLEEMLNVRIEVDRTGAASISGELRELDSEAGLTFRFGSDVSFLRPLREQLLEIVRAFPVR